jgi:hypothetical protein
MSDESWEKYLNSDSGYQYDENTQRYHDHGTGFWHTEGGTLPQNYNHIRASEVQTRNQEIFRKVIHFYFSRNGAIMLAVSIILCLVTDTFSPEGFFFWNILLAIIVLAFYEMTVRTNVRAEWNEIWEEIETI